MEGHVLCICLRRTLVCILAIIFTVIEGRAQEANLEVQAEAAENDAAALPEPPMSPAQLQTRVRELTRELRNSQAEYRSLVDEANNRAAMAQSMLQSANSRVPAFDFMPGAVHPNLMGENDIAPTETRFGAGSRIGNTGFIFRTILQGNATSTYDTGFVAAGQQMDPGTIAFDGTADHRQAGFFDMSEAIANLAVDLQKQFTETGDDIQAQAYLEAQLDTAGDLQVRHAFGRVDFTNVYLVAGKYWTAWGDEGTLPKSLSLNTTAAGSVFAIAPQLRLATALNDDWLASVAIQDPLVTTIDPADPTDPGPPIPDTPNTVLQRYPDLALRLRYLDAATTGYNSFSVGAVIRGLGVETDLGDEQIRTGWGITVNGRTLIFPCTALQFGAVGGRGLGGDIFGLQTTPGIASGPTNHLKIQSNYGAYLGVTRLLSESLQFNAAYGFARGDSTPAVSFQETQNAWSNLIYRQSDQLSVGLEYHWGQNEMTGVSGENHRFLLSVQITPKAQTEAVGVASVTAAPLGAARAPAMIGGAPASEPNMVQPLPNGGEVSRFKRL